MTCEDCPRDASCACDTRRPPTEQLADKLLAYMRERFGAVQRRLFEPDPYYTKVDATKDEMLAAFRVLAERGDLDARGELYCPVGHDLWGGPLADVPKESRPCEQCYDEDEDYEFDEDEEPFVRVTWVLTDKGAGPPPPPKPTYAELEAENSRLREALSDARQCIADAHTILAEDGDTGRRFVRAFARLGRGLFHVDALLAPEATS